MSFNQMDCTQRRWFDAIRASLSRDLLSSTWRKKVPVGSHRVCGHCYIATEAAFHAFGRQAGFKCYVVSLGGGGTHRWLAHPETEAVIDLTYEQTQKSFNYKAGRNKTMRRGNGPNGISRRGAILLERARKIIDAA
jgi:hypothetical protein